MALSFLSCYRRRSQRSRPEPGRPGETVHIALEPHYGEHPDVAYKLMELRNHDLQNRTRGSIQQDEVLGMTTFKKPPRPGGDHFYERPKIDMNSGVKLEPLRTCIEGDPECLGCSHEKENCYLFDLVRAPTPLTKSFNSSCDTLEADTPQPPPQEILAR